MNRDQWSASYIDMVYTLVTIRMVDRRAFRHARHFFGMFRRMYALHPLADMGDGSVAYQRNTHRILNRQLLVRALRPRVLS